MDIRMATGDRFEPRITDGGRPVGFETDGDMILIRRERGAPQKVDTQVGLGLVALCSHDGAVLGYGTMDVPDLEALADDVDAALGGLDGTPLQRLAGHDLVMVLPLDAMPAPLRDMFLEERVPTALVIDAGLTDEILGDAATEHHHDHDHGTDADCAACAAEGGLDDVRDQIERIVGAMGHAVVSVPPSKDSPGVSYSVGLVDTGWPELVVTGLVGDQGILVVNAAVTALRKGERIPRDGLVVEGAISVPLRLRSIDADSGRRMTSAASDRHARMGGRPEAYRAMQLLWPDASGRFPDETGYDGRGLPDQVLIDGPGRNGGIL
jgi:hypothetical protein